MLIDIRALYATVPAMRELVHLRVGIQVVDRWISVGGRGVVALALGTDSCSSYGYVRAHLQPTVACRFTSVRFYFSSRAKLGALSLSAAHYSYMSLLHSTGHWTTEQCSVALSPVNHYAFMLAQ
jgi:hypothetical protein